MIANRRSPFARRRAITIIDLVLTTFLLGVAMTVTVEVLGWVAAERRAADRRQCAVEEAANLMEHLAAEPWDRVTPEAAQRLRLSEPARRTLPSAELTVDVGLKDKDKVASKRLAIRLRWRTRSGGWEAPVRLTAWITRRNTP